MSGLINKAKAVLHKDKGDNPQADNYGHHSSNLANKADPRVDSDRDGGRNANVHPDTYGSNTTGGYGGSNTVHNSTTSGYGDNTTGGYGSNTTGGYGSNTTAGPHSSNLANKLDPRVDSDLDGGRTVGSNQGGYGQQTGGYGQQTGGYGQQTGGYGSSATAGPHSSNLANKADPRVDSDLDGGRTLGSNQGGYGQQTGGYGSSTGAYDSNTGVSSGGYGSHTQGSTNAGPHNSNLANKLDPRVDSDRDNRNDPTSRVGGYGGQDNYGASGTNPSYGQQHNTGYDQQTGSSGYGNQGYGNTDQYGSSATPGSGNAEKTAGPHNSNLLNKLDPRVDSDADGSKTYGGNQTYR